MDTSAPMAILLGDPDAARCAAVLEAEDALLISAGTVAETLIVAGRRNLGAERERLIDGLGFEIVSVTHASARRIARTYDLWGNGVHPASLNFGDCLACDVARQRNCALPYVGDDFARTDIASALV